MSILLRGAEILALPVILLVLLGAAFLTRLQRGRSWPPRLVWGPVPILNNKYWSSALREAGFPSETLMTGFYGSINRRQDFDLYFHDVAPFRGTRLNAAWTAILGPYSAFLYALRRFEIFHHPFSGGFLGGTFLWKLEARLLHLAGKKIVILPYGGDAYMYSRVLDPSLHHGLLLSYPGGAGQEGIVKERVSYWTQHADAIVSGMLIDGLGRWDVLPVTSLGIDTASWFPRQYYSEHDGISGVVRVIHTPNHRGFKGTEFLIEAVRVLQEEGLRIELVLLERIPNHEVRRIMREEADILAEQFIFTGYALSGLEGMASGLPVLANLDNEVYTRLFRRYSYLSECPVLSTTPETLVDNLRALVTNPALRAALGRAGRAYVEKYHSYEAVQYLFGSIYRHLRGEPVNLLNLFHPLISDFNRRRPPVEHPLAEGHLRAHAAGPQHSRLTAAVQE